MYTVSSQLSSAFDVWASADTLSQHTKPRCLTDRRWTITIIKVCFMRICSVMYMQWLFMYMYPCIKLLNNGKLFIRTQHNRCNDPGSYVTIRLEAFNLY